MSEKEHQFKAELFALFNKYGCSFETTTAYYAGDPQTTSVRIDNGTSDISIDDLINESGRPSL